MAPGIGEAFFGGPLFFICLGPLFFVLFAASWSCAWQPFLRFASVRFSLFALLVNTSAFAVFFALLVFCFFALLFLCFLLLFAFCFLP